MTIVPDAVYGVQKVHGYTTTGYESLTSNFEFLTITTSVSILTYAANIAANAVNPANPTPTEIAAATESQGALDKLIQIVSERAQPVIMGNVSGNVIMMALEHPNVWGCLEESPIGPPWNSTTTNLPAIPPVRLVDRIAADGIGYGLTATVVFSNVLT